MASVKDVKGTAHVLYGMAFDVVIRGGRVLDGAGSPWRVADIGIRGGKIARVGRLGRAKWERAIDASGTYVAPGFIDIHTHSDIGILVEPRAECAVRQGVTTHVIGNCGDSDRTARAPHGASRTSESAVGRSHAWAASGVRNGSGRSTPRGRTSPPVSSTFTRTATSASSSSPGRSVRSDRASRRT